MPVLAAAQLRGRVASIVVASLLLGSLLGGAMAAAAGARRSASALPRFLDAQRVEDLTIDLPPGLDVAAVDRLPEVEAAEDVTFIGMALAPADERGHDDAAFGAILPFVRVPRVGGPGAVARPLVVEGRVPDPAAPLEAGVNEELARIAHLRVGEDVDVVTLGPDQQRVLIEGGTPTGPRLTLRVVGILRRSDDLEPPASEFDAGTAFATQRLELTPAFDATYGERVARFDPLQQVLRLRHGRADVPAFRGALASLPGGDAASIEVGTGDGDVARRAIGVETVALAALAVVLAIAGFVLGGLALVRLARDTAASTEALRALGFERRQRIVVAALPAAGAASIGLALAVVVAVAGSTFAPIGLARLAEVDPGVRVDPVVLVVGVAVGSVVLAAISLAGAAVSVSTSPSGMLVRRSRSAEWLAAAGAPVGAVVGCHMATGSGARTRAAPIGFALVAGAIGMIAVGTTLTYTTSLDHLHEDRADQGWTWDLKVGDPFLADFGPADLTVLDDDPRVIGYVPVSDLLVDATVDGRPMPLGALELPHGDADLAVLRGHLPEQDGEVTLGRSSAEDLGVDVGDTVEVQVESTTASMRVVGVALLNPAIADSMSIGDGAIVSRDQAEQLGSTDVPVNGLLVVLDDGADVDQVANDFMARWGPIVGRPVTPRDVDNLIRVRRLPPTIAAVVAAMALAVVAFVLLMTVRERRSDLRTLLALGASRRQLRSTVVMLAGVLWAPAAVVGLPLGIVVGRLAWRMTADGVGTTAGPRVPLGALGFSVAGALAVLLATALVPSVRTRHSSGPAPTGRVAE